MFLQNATKHFLEQGLDILQPAHGEVIMLLLAEKSADDVEGIIRLFNERGIVFFGGMFPGLVHADERLEEGAIMKKFRTVAKPYLIRNIADKKLDGLPGNLLPDSEGHLTAILLLDGLTSNINYFLDSLNNQIGDRVNFIGGGAGSGSLKQQRCLFNNAGFFEDAALCCLLEAKSSLGVQHGWKKFAGPIVATATDGATIQKLNWHTAFDVYKSYMEKDCGAIITSDNFLYYTKDFPFGMYRENADFVVRDPIGVNELGEVSCIGEIPPNTVLYVLKSSPELLIQAATAAMRDCLENAPWAGMPDNTFVVDCITRPSALGERYRSELEAIRSQLDIASPEQEPFGILSLGEISSYGEGLLEFFNKTIVVGALHD